MAESLMKSEPGDELERAFPGSRLSHVLSVRSRSRLDTAIEILQLLHASGASLTAMNVARYEDAFEQRLILTGLGAQQARALAGRVADAAGVESARVEHQICRPS